MPLNTGPRKRLPSQPWMTFVRNHALAMLASDFFVVVTARFRVLYVFVIMEVGTRKIAHFNVTDHPTAAWTIQQFRDVITGEQPYRFVLHDRDRIYSTELDGALKSLGVIVLRTPFRAPQANSFCERLVGTIRRECLDFLIPLNERHVRRILKEWVAHYNQGRPHSSLGPGIPDPGEAFATTRNRHRHQLSHDGKVVGLSVLGDCITSTGWKGLPLRHMRWVKNWWVLICISFTCITGCSPTVHTENSMRRFPTQGNIVTFRFALAAGFSFIF